MTSTIRTSTHCGLVAAMLMMFMLVAFAGCGFPTPIPGSGKIDTETRQVQDFHGLRVIGSAEVTYTIDDLTSCEIQADDNLLPLIRTTVTNNILKVDYEGLLQPTETIRVRLTGPPLASVGIVGSGRFNTTEVADDRFDFSVTGSGQGTVAGSSKTLKVQISGSGKLNASQLECSEASVEITGSGGAAVHVDSSLRVSITGSGNVTYSGNADVTTKIVGSGNATPAERLNIE